MFQRLISKSILITRIKKHGTISFIPTNSRVHDQLLVLVSNLNTGLVSVQFTHGIVSQTSRNIQEWNHINKQRVRDKIQSERNINKVLVMSGTIAARFHDKVLWFTHRTMFTSDEDKRFMEKCILAQIRILKGKSHLSNKIGFFRPF